MRHLNLFNVFTDNLNISIIRKYSLQKTANECYLCAKVLCLFYCNNSQIRIGSISFNWDITSNGNTIINEKYFYQIMWEKDTHFKKICSIGLPKKKLATN